MKRGDRNSLRRAAPEVGLSILIRLYSSLIAYVTPFGRGIWLMIFFPPSSIGSHYDIGIPPILLSDDTVPFPDAAVPSVSAARKSRRSGKRFVKRGDLSCISCFQRRNSMKQANVTCMMADGSILHTLEEAKQYGRTHEFPPFAMDAIQMICKAGSKTTKK